MRDAIGQQHPLAQLITDDIPECNSMTWWKYGLSFVASNRSVVLLMISNATGGFGNDLAIDDIELRVWSTADFGFCPSGQYIYYCLDTR